MISGGAHLTTPFASVSGPMPAFLVRSKKFRDLRGFRNTPHQ